MEALVEESSFLKRLYDEVRGPCPPARKGKGMCGDLGERGKGALCACVCPMCDVSVKRTGTYEKECVGCLSQTWVYVPSERLA